MWKVQNTFKGKLRIIEEIVNILYPSGCPICSGPSSFRFYPFCKACWLSIRPYRGNRCSFCSIPLPEHTSICGECISSRPYFHGSFVYGLYEGVLKEAIHHLKYLSVRSLAAPLSELLLTTSLPEADLVVPVPPDSSRLKKRYFNHTSLIARYLSKRLRIPLSLDSLIKIKSTPPQTGLKREERQKNLRNSFRVTRRFSGERILLIDDVITTGITVQECSKQLFKAGASRIYVVALARSYGDIVSSIPIDISDAGGVI